jgi:hypothetical protein
MAAKGEKTLVQLDWFNVSYRSILNYAVLILVLLVGGGGYWYYTGWYAPKKDAQQAIEQAVDAFQTAEQHEDLPGPADHVKHAGASLDTARNAFAGSNYDEAEFQALLSLDRSLTAIDLAKGQAESVRVRFSRIEGDVRVKKQGEFSWQPAVQRMGLTVGDQVKTSSSASAEIVYFDGTTTLLKPGSLLEIHKLYEDPVTKVRRVEEKLNFGEVKASTPNRNVNGSYHQVETDAVQARADRASEFNVSYKKETKISRVSSFRGPLDVTGGGSTSSLIGGESVKADAQGQLSSKEALPGVARLEFPADQRVFIFEDPLQEKIILQWQQVNGSERYHLIISDKPLFTDPLYQQNREGNSATLEGVEPGSYYWKVAAVSALGGQGPYSEARTFRISSEKIRDRTDKKPPGLEITEFVTIGLLVIVNGKSEPGATLWVDDEKVDIYDDGRFYAVVRLRKEGNNDVVFRAQDTAGNETSLSRSTYVEVY